MTVIIKTIELLCIIGILYYLVYIACQTEKLYNEDSDLSNVQQ